MASNPAVVKAPKHIMFRTSMDSLRRWSTHYIGTEVTARQPRGGRVRLRPNRGFARHPALSCDPPCDWALHVILPCALDPHESWVDESTHSIGGDVTREGDMRSPGSDGASPYPRRGFPRQPAL